MAQANEANLAQPLTLLKRSGLAQQDIAEQLNVPESAVSMWSTGARPIPPQHKARLWALVDENWGNAQVDVYAIEENLLPAALIAVCGTLARYAETEPEALTVNLVDLDHVDRAITRLQVITERLAMSQPNGVHQPPERVVFIPVTVLPNGGVQVQGVSFRGLPQRPGQPWSGWQFCHDILLKGAEIAQQKMLEEIFDERRIQIAGEMPPELPGG